MLPAAGGQTYGQLRAAVARAVILADPEGAEERREATERRARVGLYPAEASRDRHPDRDEPARRASRRRDGPPHRPGPRYASRRRWRRHRPAALPRLPRPPPRHPALHPAPPRRTAPTNDPGPDDPGPGGGGSGGPGQSDPDAPRPRRRRSRRNDEPGNDEPGDDGPAGQPGAAAARRDPPRGAPETPARRPRPGTSRTGRRRGPSDQPTPDDSATEGPATCWPGQPGRPRPWPVASAGRPARQHGHLARRPGRAAGPTAPTGPLRPLATRSGRAVARPARRSAWPARTARPATHWPCSRHRAAARPGPVPGPRPRRPGRRRTGRGAQ